MTGYRLLDSDPPATAVRVVTFVPFRPDGSCVAVMGDGGGLLLPAGAIEPGEHYLLDSTLRIPLATAGFRFQRVRPFALDGDHAYLWIEGDRYSGHRPHARVDWWVGDPDALARTLPPEPGRAVRDAAASYRNQDDASYYADNLRLLEPAYLRGSTAAAGSGFGGSAEDWRRLREPLVDGIDRDGTFLDVGCANGLLMDSVRRWAAERGLRIEPYGVDLAPRLVELARRRYPAWTGRLVVGNAIDHVPADGRRTTFVHVLLDLVPSARRAELVRHALDALVEPGGRLLVSHYVDPCGTQPHAAQELAALGVAVAGRAGATAWVHRPG